MLLRIQVNRTDDVTEHTKRNLTYNSSRIITRPGETGDEVRGGKMAYSNRSCVHAVKNRGKRSAEAGLEFPRCDARNAALYATRRGVSMWPGGERDFSEYVTRRHELPPLQEGVVHIRGRPITSEYRTELLKFLLCYATHFPSPSGTFAALAFILYSCGPFIFQPTRMRMRRASFSIRRCPIDVLI